MTLRRKLYLVLHSRKKESYSEKTFDFILISIIILNILAIMLESVEGVEQEYGEIFRGFEIFSIIFFTIEYFCRLYSIVENKRFQHPIKGRLRWAKTSMAIVDLLAFLPFYLSFFADLRFLRIFRLMALFRLFKIARYLYALGIFRRVLRDRKEQLVLSFIFILFILVFISFVMFYAEHEAQPDEFSSIPATMWWGIATLTTVGYGDIVPITPLGKLLGGLFAITGVGLLALPAGILSSGFFQLLHQKPARQEKCPHCGEVLHD